MTVSPPHTQLSHEPLKLALRLIFLRTKLGISPVRQVRGLALLWGVPPQQRQQGKTDLRWRGNTGSTKTKPYGDYIRAHLETEQVSLPRSYLTPRLITATSRDRNRVHHHHRVQSREPSLPQTVTKPKLRSQEYVGEGEPMDGGRPVPSRQGMETEQFALGGMG